MLKLQRQFNELFAIAEKWRAKAIDDGVEGDSSKEYTLGDYTVRIYCT